MNSINGNTERLVPDVVYGEHHQYDIRSSGRGVFLRRVYGATMFIRPNSLLSENQSLLNRQITSSSFLNNSLFFENAVNTSK